MFISVFKFIVKQLISQQKSDPSVSAVSLVLFVSWKTVSCGFRISLTSLVEAAMAFRCRFLFLKFYSVLLIAVPLLRSDMVLFPWQTGTSERI